VFLFSGHGGQAEDEDGDEEDGYDETICALDQDIIDDELHAILVAKLPKGADIAFFNIIKRATNTINTGVRLTCIFDCCNSGTGLDLPYACVIKPPKTSSEFKEALEADSLKDQWNIYKQHKQSTMDVGGRLGGEGQAILFGGCSDGYCSGDICIGGSPCGILCYSLCNYLRKNPK